MDPVSAGGIAIGVTSLAFDVFENCVKVFRFLSIMVDMPREQENCRLRLLIEYNRFLAWGKEVGLVDNAKTSSIAASLGTNFAELSGIISHIRWLLEQFNNIGERWNGLKPQDMQQTSGDSADFDICALSLDKAFMKTKQERKSVKGTNHLISWMAKSFGDVKEIVANPRRIHWAVVDKDAFEALLKDLHILTGRLHQLIGDFRLGNIAEITSKTYRELVLTRNDVQELKDMFIAISAFMNTSAASGDTTWGWRKDIDEEFRHLLRLKEINRTADSMLETIDENCLVDDGGLKALINVRMYEGATLDRYFEPTTDEGARESSEICRLRGVLKTSEEGIQVWVEWRCNGSAQHASERIRVMTLAELLHVPKPKSLSAPTCLGYIDDIAMNGRFGWIFAMPNGSTSSTTLKSLNSILNDAQYRPTLGQRVTLAYKLATSLLHLHTCDWLHKGIHSGNVVFPFDGDEYDPERPILSGFDYSRSQNSRTISSSVEPKWDIYRWPSIQNEAPKAASSRKTYDIYSLGLVLLEIAHWKPLRTIICLEDGIGDASEGSWIRAWLLGEDDPPFDSNPLLALRDIAGDKYWEAVTRCIEAHGERGLHIEEHMDQAWSPNVGLKIQDAFEELVVQRLRNVSI